MHVRILSAVVVGGGERAVERLDAAAVGLDPVPVDHLERVGEQLVCALQPGERGRRRGQQHVRLPVELLAVAGLLAADGGVPAAVLVVASVSVEVEAEAVLGDLPGAGAPHHGGHREAVQHPRAQPQL